MLIDRKYEKTFLLDTVAVLNNDYRLRRFTQLQNVTTFKINHFSK